MTKHFCATGSHDKPNKWCYSNAGHKCRCDGCTDEWRQYVARWRNDPLASLRQHITALQDAGWTVTPPAVATPPTDNQ
jgi:hypothetical protein